MTFANNGNVTPFSRVSRLALTAVCILVISSCNDNGAHSDPLLGTAVVKQGSFEIAVSGKGQLRPLKEEPITAHTWGIISFMWEHGKAVKQGEVVFTIDDSDRRERLEGDRYDLEIRKAQLTKTEKQQSQRVHSAQRAVTQAQNELAAKVIELAELKAIPAPDDLENAKNTLSSASRICELRTSELEIIRKLHSSGAVSFSEVQDAETKYQRARIQMEKAATNLAKIEAGPTIEDLRRAELNVLMAKLDLQRAEKQLKAVENSAETVVENARVSVRHREDALRRDEDRLKQYRETAPIDGMVLHGPGRWGMPWQPGRDAGRGFMVMSIPSLEKMKAVIAIPESDIADVRPSQDTRLHVTAIPDATFTGKVHKVVDVARDEFEDLHQYTQEKLGRAERRVFTVEIALDQSDERLRPGFNVTAQIIIDEHKDALLIPLAAVGISPAEKTYADIITSGNGYRRAEIEVLAHDEGMAQVSGDIRPGDVVRIITEEERLYRSAGPLPTEMGYDN